MARYWVMGAVGSAVLHGAVAATFLLNPSQPPEGGTTAPASEVITVELFRLTPDQPPAGAPSEAESEPIVDTASETPSTAAPVVAPSSPSPDASNGHTRGSAPSASTVSAAALSDYFRVLEAHLAQHHRYPIVETGRPEGTVRVAMIIGRSGDVLDVWIETSSGQVKLDEAALATVRRAAPMPDVPSSLPGAIDLIVPLRFTREGAG